MCVCLCLFDVFTWFYWAFSKEQTRQICVLSFRSSVLANKTKHLEKSMLIAHILAQKSGY